MGKESVEVSKIPPQLIFGLMRAGHCLSVAIVFTETSPPCTKRSMWFPVLSAKSEPRFYTVPNGTYHKSFLSKLPSKWSISVILYKSVTFMKLNEIGHVEKGRYSAYGAYRSANYGRSVQYLYAFVSRLVFCHDLVVLYFIPVTPRVGGSTLRWRVHFVLIETQRQIRKD